MNFGKNLQVLRKMTNLTQENLAELINTSYGNLLNKIKGKRVWTLKEMVAIQEVLNQKLDAQLSLDYLFKK